MYKLKNIITFKKFRKLKCYFNFLNLFLQRTNKMSQAQASPYHAVGTCQLEPRRGYL